MSGASHGLFNINFRTCLDTGDDLVSIILDVVNGNADASDLFQWLHEHQK